MEKKSKKAKIGRKLVVAGCLVVGAGYVGYELGIKHEAKRNRKQLVTLLESVFRTGDAVVTLDNDNLDKPVVLLIKEIEQMPDNYHMIAPVKV
jgi:hypothetical protein